MSDARLRAAEARWRASGDQADLIRLQELERQAGIRYELGYPVCTHAFWALWLLQVGQGGDYLLLFPHDVRQMRCVGCRKRGPLRRAGWDSWWCERCAMGFGWHVSPRGEPLLWDAREDLERIDAAIGIPHQFNILRRTLEEGTITLELGTPAPETFRH